MKTLRLSYSLMQMWRQGRVDEMLLYYFKLGEVTNPFTEDGKRWDHYVNTFVQAQNRLPKEFGEDPILDPYVQLKVEGRYSPRFDLVGVIDVYDRETKTLYEIKTGRGKDSADYANDFQVGLYLLLLDDTPLPVEKAVIVHYNQYEKKLDRTIIWNGAFEVERAKNYIDSLAPEIYTFFEEASLL